MTQTPLRLAHLARVSLIIIALWIIFALFSSSEFYRRGQAVGTSSQHWSHVLYFQLASAMFWAVFTPLIIFVAERLPLEKPHRLRNAATLLAFAAAMSVIRAATGGAMGQIAEGTRPTLDFIELSINVRFHRNVFLILMIVGITNLVLLQRNAAARERAQLAMRAAVVKAELQQFRAAMQPAFVLSTLDSIGEYVARDPERADRMLIEFADLLRSMLDLQTRRDVALLEELELIDRHVDLYRTSRGVALRSRVDVDEELLAARVPPMVLHSAVESAIAGGRAPAWVEIRGHADGGLLHLEVRNDERAGGSEHTLDDARARLRHLFDKDTDVRVRHDAGVLITEMSMPLQLRAADGDA
jgi:two-component system LytT family sensor kinase